jgi:hypothetical protein
VAAARGLKRRARSVVNACDQPMRRPLNRRVVERREAVPAMRRFYCAFIVAFVAGAIPRIARSDTPLSPADNAKREAALSRCTGEMQRKLGPASFPARTVEDIESE